MWWLLPIQTVSGTHRQLLCPSWCYNTKWDLITVHCFSVPLICMLEEVCWDSILQLLLLVSLWETVCDWLFLFIRIEGWELLTPRPLCIAPMGFVAHYVLDCYTCFSYFFLFFSLVLSFCLLLNIPRKYGSHHLYVIINWEINDWEGF